MKPIMVIVKIVVGLDGLKNLTRPINPTRNSSRVILTLGKKEKVKMIYHNNMTFWHWFYRRFEWHKWFAWHPITLEHREDGSKMKAFLQWVYRKRIEDECFGYWKYSAVLPNNGVEQTPKLRRGSRQPLGHEDESIEHTRTVGVRNPEVGQGYRESFTSLLAHWPIPSSCLKAIRSRRL